MVSRLIFLTNDAVIYWLESSVSCRCRRRALRISITQCIQFQYHNILLTKLINVWGIHNGGAGEDHEVRPK